MGRFLVGVVLLAVVRASSAAEPTVGWDGTLENGFVNKSIAGDPPAYMVYGYSKSYGGSVMSITIKGFGACNRDPSSLPTQADYVGARFNGQPLSMVSTCSNLGLAFAFQDERSQRRVEEMIKTGQRIEFKADPGGYNYVFNGQNGKKIYREVFSQKFGGNLIYDDPE